MAVRFGILGCSSVARRRFLPALEKSSLARLEHVGSRSASKAAEYAKAFNCSKAGSYEAVLEDPQVDAVYISIPVALHEPWLRKAVQGKKHILCEKPAFENFRAAREIVRLCRESGVRLMEGYMFRYHLQHALVKRLLSEGRIGTPRFFHGEYAVPRPPADDIRCKPELGGGVFLDAAGYLPAAAMLQLEGNPVSVFCRKSSDAATGVDDAVAMLAVFDNGVMAHFSAGYGLQYRARYSVLGTQGRVEVERAFAVNPDYRATVLLETDKGTENFSIEAADQFLRMIDDFAQPVNGQASTRRAFEEDVLRQHAFMDAASRSNLEQRVVLLSEYSS